MRVELMGKVQTVLGLIKASDLGITLTHEHLMLDMSVYFVEPTEASEKKLAYEPVKMDNLYWVKTHWANHKDNMVLNNEQLAVKEALLYKSAGGDTIVELSNIGLGRDPLGLARISRATGLNIVMGAGCYVGLSHHQEMSAKTEEEITEEIVRDIMVGVGSTGVRAGIIGEIGCSTPISDNERKVLRASAAAQRRTGAAINVHPPAREELALDVVEILGNAGGDLGRTIISHIDVWGYSLNTCHKLADAGCYLEYDTFGYEGLFPYEGEYFPLDLREGYLDLPSDVKRVSDIIQLIADGYLNKLLISQDICMKHFYTAYGGYGYAHILRDVVPVMRSQGMSEEQIHTLLLENPKRVLQLVDAK